MPPIEEIAIDETESETVAKPVIGIIYPPPEVRSILRPYKLHGVMTILMILPLLGDNQ